MNKNGSVMIYIYVNNASEPTEPDWVKLSDHLLRVEKKIV